MIKNQVNIHSTTKSGQWIKKRVFSLSTQIASLALISALALPPVLNADEKGAVIPAYASTMQTMPASFAEVVEKVRPAVVSISVTTKSGPDWPEFRQFRRHPKEDSPLDDFLRRFLEEFEPFRKNGGLPRHPKASGVGSGFIIDADGFVVTNHHVIEGAGEITVTLNDGSKYSPKVVGHDAKTDLALLKVDAKKPLPYMSFGDSDKARVGDWVIAVGNPYGFGDTFTAGIISARGRDIQSGPYDDFIQVDAPINKGNSGGPLLNMNGEVIGINTAIYSPTGGNVGIGFSVPSSMAKSVLAQLRESGSVKRGWLGVQIQSITEDMAESLGLPETQGAMVAQVLPDTPAKKAGLIIGDVILEVNGKPVKTAKMLARLVGDAEVGKPAEFGIWRHGSKKTVNIVLGRMEGEEKVVVSQEEQKSTDVVGFRLETITDTTRKQYKLADDIEGVVIVDVKNDSPAAEAGLKQGDVIIMVGQEKVATPEEVEQKVKEIVEAKRKAMLLLLKRQDSQQFVTVKMK
ncbi:DegQ family serine endoprotease [Candidatus Parabeggiatoa sp. HSG14]|uniref:DegQ family serine endoprotease n=1 Tax=Candidatus Parabeggiatoa sp. HSG14 TaxID=3055593 RepID=UPI0025A84474|nr:DegQ family serine endoprotease [Thiotrichales bacterium HSG14]